MKKIFSILMVCCATFVFADDAPVFEEADDVEAKVCCYAPFAMENEDGKDEALRAFLKLENPPEFEETDEHHTAAFGSFISWSRYKANFGMEKLFLRFPHKPYISQSNVLLTAYAYDHTVMYSLSGYYPPVGNIAPLPWFDEVLYSYSVYPYNLLSHVVVQESCGDWVMDYIAHDYIQDLTIKGRAIVTPFNAYTLLCVKPTGTRDHFDYFVDNFWIRCDCHD